MQPPRAALVTGGNRGIGLEVCRQLTALDCRVVLTSRDLSKADAAVRGLRSGEIEPAQLDVDNAESIRTLAKGLAAPTSLHLSR